MSAVYIVTGGTHGIGRACVEQLASASKAVFCVGRDEVAGRLIQRDFPTAKFQLADVADEDQCRVAVQRALEMGDGQIGGLVNNAGMSMRRAFHETSGSDWDAIFAVNTRSAFHLTKFSLEGLQSARGAVVNIASVAGMTGAEGMVAYCATKAALIGMTQALAVEYGETVRFNAVCPGQVNTRMMAATMSDPVRLSALERTIPARRVSDPHEVADVVCWLLSPASSYVNGAIIPIDGGETAGIRSLDTN